MTDITRGLESAEDVVDFDALYRRLSGEPGFAARLIEQCAQPEHQRAVLWMLKRYLESDGEIDAADVDRLLAAFPSLEGWEARLMALQSLPMIDIPAARRAQIEAFVRDNLAGRNKFLRAWAYNGFEILARQYPEYRREADALLEMGLRDEPPAIKARIRNILKQRS